jgi:sialate O-acetylesterase
MKVKLMLLLPLFMGVCLSLSATVKISSLFSDGAVLQRDKYVMVWGWGDENESVTVSFDGQTISTKVQNGKWSVQLKPMKTDAKPQKMIVKGKNNVIEINDILIGEVWICSGQSNMEWNVQRTNGGDEAISQSNNNLLRICVVPHNVKYSPVDNVPVKWAYASPKSVYYASAVGYYFMSKLQKEMNIPVGMLQIAFGGTVIESWMSKEALSAMPHQDKYMDAKAMKAEYDTRIAKIQPIIDAYEHAKDSARVNKLPAPPRPSEIPSEYKGTTTIYNGEIYPVAPFTVRGIVWYQGESNAYPQRADTYYELLPRMIQLWRSLWKEPKLPFVVIQITPNRKPQTDPNEWSGIAVVQDAEAKTAMATPYTALVTTMDCAEENVHYREKKPVGDRVLLAAKYLCYGSKAEYCGPVFKAMTIKGNKCIVSYHHASNGLSQKGDKLQGFVVAGADKKFYFADAKIIGNTVEVSSPQVLQPVAVRYGWANFPKVNLFNKEMLPASPFRTDNWKN